MTKIIAPTAASTTTTTTINANHANSREDDGDDNGDEIQYGYLVLRCFILAMFISFPFAILLDWMLSQPLAKTIQNDLPALVGIVVGFYTLLCIVAIASTMTILLCHGYICHYQLSHCCCRCCRHLYRNYIITMCITLILLTPVNMGCYLGAILHREGYEIASIITTITGLLLLCVLFSVQKSKNWTALLLYHYYQYTQKQDDFDKFDEFGQDSFEQ
jgi:hypothetical protein